jgi:PBP1b-binding outer membrane lipoprotein LpoB
MMSRYRFAVLLALVLAGCTNRPSNRVVKVAEYYVERLADTAQIDSAAISAGKTWLDSATADWTVAEWQEFWNEVQERRPR